MKAIWNDKVIAESNETVVVEGNHYFPEKDVKKEYLNNSDTKSHCPWKGDALYYSINVNGEINEDAAWYYPEPSELAKQIKNRIAFWKGVEVTK